MLALINLFRRIIVLDRSRRDAITAERLTRRHDEDDRRRHQQIVEGLSSKPQSCSDCGGGGSCPVCAGRPISRSHDGQQEVCGACGGSGRCPTCGGSGQLR